MSKHIPIPEIQIRIIEIDPSLHIPLGYDDPETGEWITTMTDEEVDEYIKKAEKMRYFRARVVCNDKTTELRSSWVSQEEDPTPVLREMTEKIWDSFSKNKIYTDSEIQR